MESGPIRRKHNGSFKAKVAVEAIRGQKTIPEISRQFGVHASQVSKWKQQILEGLPGIFDERGADQRQEDQSEKEARLYQQIGQLQVELDWLKKKSERFCL